MYQSLGVPLSWAGVVSMIVSAGTVVSSLASERLIRRFGTGLVTAVSVVMTAAALLGFALSRHFALLCVLAVPLGLGGGSVDAALNNYVALHYKAWHMSWLHCFWGVGASLGPIIMSAFLLRGVPWHAGYFTMSGIQFCLAAVLFVSLPVWKGKERGGKCCTNPPPSLPPEGGGGRRQDSNLLAVRGIKPMLASFFAYCAIESTAGLWGASFLVRSRGIEPATAAQWISLFYAGITFGRFLSGFVTIKLNSRQMVRLGQGIILLGVILLLLPLGRAFLLPAFFLIGLGCAPIYPSLMYETPANFGADRSQAVIGLQMASAYIGTTLMPPLFGWIAAHIGFSAFPWYIGLALAAQVVAVEMVNRK
jgi:fucose permease